MSNLGKKIWGNLNQDFKRLIISLAEKLHVLAVFS